MPIINFYNVNQKFRPHTKLQWNSLIKLKSTEEKSSQLLSITKLHIRITFSVVEKHLDHNLWPGLRLIRDKFWLDLIIDCRSTVEHGQRVLAASPPEKTEHDAEYECDVDDYHPEQPLVHDHGVSFVCLSSVYTKIDQHVIQVSLNLQLIWCVKFKSASRFRI